jgi:CHASE2 domain-containing sensor protein
MRSTQNSHARVGVIIVACHFLISLVHGAAHGSLHIDLERWQTVYVLLVITVAPLVSGVLLWRRARVGFILLMCSMLGALIFGCYYHFIAAGIDNVASVGSDSWGSVFRVTAVLLGVTEAAGVLTGVVGLLKK